MSIKVFVAYADSYIGRTTVEQYFLRPAQYTIYGCTWEENAVEPLRETYSERVFDALPLPHNDEDDNNDEESIEKSHGSVPMGDSRGTLEPAQERKSVSQSVFFHRKDVSAMRNALLLCDWIIVELRQAQDIFEMLHFIKKSSFVKTKKFVLLSSFLTWYATPPLTGPAPQEGNEDKEDEDNDSLRDSLTAPIPPPSDDQYNKLLEPSDDAAPQDEDKAEGEILTEEQFNRRVPHVQYFNWRDAEKAVASAHRANGLPLDTFVVFAGLPYGSGEGPLEPFFRLSWSSKSTDLLPVFEPGTQRIPMIHVADLAEVTRRLLRCPLNDLPNPSLRYLFAVDGANPSWTSIISAIKKGFRNERPTVTVKENKFPLHTNIEHFTLNLTVSGETAEALMSREDDDVEPILMEQRIKRKDGAWTSPGGFLSNVDSVCAEFRLKRHVTPLRLAVLGPPQSGKTFLASRLERFYDIPVFSLEKVVAEYEQGVQVLKDQLVSLNNELNAQEKTRRLQVKQKRFIKRKQKSGDEVDEETEEGVIHHRRQDSDDEGDMPLSLTEEEERESTEFVNDLFERSTVVVQKRNQIAEMERVLLTRQYIPSDEASDPNPKKKMAQSKKKSLKDSQKKKDEEIQALKETVATAPFQDKAIALMLRWCLSRAESFNQGFILDGLPNSVNLAKLCFRTGELVPPSTEEEALQQFLKMDPNLDKEEGESSTAASAVELCDENFLVDFLFVLEASENFLLSRIGANKSTVNAGALEKFHQDLNRYKKEFMASPYTVTNFFECASSDPETSPLTGGRKVNVNIVAVDSTESVSLPPPPQSAYAEVPPTELEIAVRECVGAPHNFGKTPLELHQEQVRAKNYTKEQMIQQVQEARSIREREEQAFRDESVHRSETTRELNEVKKADRMALELKSEPLRDYLSKSVLPLLSKGLIEVCENRPENPIEELGKWLLRNNPHDDLFLDI